MFESATDAYRSTVENELPDFSEHQRFGFMAATALSFVRPVYHTAKLFADQDELNDWRWLVADALVATTDALDGETARWFDAKTELGGILDQLIGDKLSFIPAELDLVRRGRMNVGHVAVRMARDAWVTAKRDEVYTKSAGAVDISALPFDEAWHNRDWPALIFNGKFTTADRLTTNTFLASPLAAKMPTAARETIATATTVHLVGSGIRNLREYSAALANWREDNEFASSAMSANNADL